MPRPTSDTTLQRPDLGAIAYEYMIEASERGFIGLDILPIFGVPEKSADYPVIPIEALIKIQDTVRSARGKYNSSDYEFETNTYSCKEHGWKEPVDDSEKKLYQRFFDSEEIATKRCVDIILRSQEKRIADMVFNTSNLTNSDVTTEWSVSATCTPRADVWAKKTLMRAASGLTPNTMVVSLKVLENLLISAEITDALKYTNPIELGGIEAQKRILAQYFGMDNLLVGGGIRDSAKKGQSFVIADLWEDEYCLLAKTSVNADLRDPCLGRTFLWEEDSPENVVVEQYRDEELRSEMYRVRHSVDECFVFKGAGYLMTNITA